jgi:hypothetical protein
VSIENKFRRSLLGDGEGNPVAADKRNPAENVDLGKAEVTNLPHE